MANPSTTSGPEGHFSFSGLLPGVYEVAASRRGAVDLLEGAALRRLDLELPDHHVPDLSSHHRSAPFMVRRRPLAVPEATNGSRDAPPGLFGLRCRPRPVRLSFMTKIAEEDNPWDATSR